MKKWSLLQHIRMDGSHREYIRNIEESLFFEGEKRSEKLTDFTVLLFLSTIISTYGVITDSTATVIGAMIIAPLMTPIMATAAAVTMGYPARMINALSVAILSVAAVIVLSVLLTILIPEFVYTPEVNSQILARTSPGILDLIIALASGAAGAYVIGNDDILSSLPGVAIAISLVPPLSVVGVSLADGQFVHASGAFLLFVTNFIAILLSGIVIFSLMGLQNYAQPDTREGVRKRANQFIGIGAILTFVLLALTSYNIYHTEQDKAVITTIVKDWIGDTPIHLGQVKVFDPMIDITLIGQGNITTSDQLGKQLEDRLNRDVQLTIHLIPEQYYTYPEKRYT
jgi:uncharacterized hydrophobic protein (TIGR00271 family)